MRAIEYTQFGPPLQVLRSVDVPLPVPGEGEVLLRVHAASVNALDWRLMLGKPWFVRLMARGTRKSGAIRIGVDVAGEVEAVGPGVTRFQRGDAVFGVCRGAFARVRVRCRGAPGGQARQRRVCRGRGRARRGDHGAAGIARSRPTPGRDSMCWSTALGRRRHLCGAGRQGARRRSHRRVQHPQRRHRTRDRCRPRHRLHAARTSCTTRAATMSCSRRTPTARCSTTAACCAPAACTSWPVAARRRSPRHSCSRRCSRA